MHHSLPPRWDGVNESVPLRPWNQPVNSDNLSPHDSSLPYRPSNRRYAPGVGPRNVNGIAAEDETTPNTQPLDFGEDSSQSYPSIQTQYQYSLNPSPPTPMSSPPPQTRASPLLHPSHLLHSPELSPLPTPSSRTEPSIHQLPDPPSPPPLFVLSPSPNSASEVQVDQNLPPPPPPLHLLSHPPPPPLPSLLPLPLPPPPPPPPPLLYPLSVDQSKNLVPAKPLESRAFRAQQKQDRLRDSRDSLSGLRFRLQEKRRKLRTLRHETGEKEGLAFSQIRQFLYDQSIVLPKHIEETLNDAADKRDELGLLDVEYEEDEERYDSLEWKYTQNETRFIAELTETDPGQDSLIELKESVDEREALTSFAAGSPNDWIALSLSSKTEATTNPTLGAEPQISPLTSFESQVPESPLPTETKATQLVDPGESRTETEKGLTNAPMTRTPDAWIATGISPGFDATSPLIPKLEQHDSNVAQLLLSDIQTPQISLTTSKATDGKDQPLTQVGWDQKVRLIDAWLLDILDQSLFQKAILRAYSQDGTMVMDNETWWSNVQKNWASHASDFPHFHTGDSTASHQRQSVSTFNVLGTDSVHTTPSGQDLLLPEEKKVDAEEALEIPSAIRPSDLKSNINQDTLRHRTESPVYDVALSSSTGPNTTDRTASYAGDCHSDTSMGQLSGDVNADMYQSGLANTPNFRRPYMGLSTPTRQNSRGEMHAALPSPRALSKYHVYRMEDMTPANAAPDMSATEAMDRFAQRYTTVSNPSTPKSTLTPDPFTPSPPTEINMSLVPSAII